MTTTFMHIGRFKVAPDHRDRFIEVMKDYEAFSTQRGLDHSHIIEDEKQPGTFMHVTVWNTRQDWEAIEASETHQNMHAERDKTLAEPMEHDFICGTILS
ncbi:MAG: antibiotic biosynthesis monooxygenase family protein [Pseudomonadota bacterium]